VATGAGATWVDADTHPLAASVHRWTVTNLIMWPITRKIPQHLHGYTSKVSRRGPAPTYPSLGADERTRFFDHLLTGAERGTHADEALLRRQPSIYSASTVGRRWSTGFGPSGTAPDVAR
jgi:hypothetical protein